MISTFFQFLEPRAHSTRQMREFHSTEYVLEENSAQHVGTARVVLVAKHFEDSDQLFGKPEFDGDLVRVEALVFKFARADLTDVAHEAGSTGCVGPHDDVLLV